MVGGVAAVGLLVAGLVVLGDGRDSDPMDGSVPTVGSTPVISEAVTVPTTPAAAPSTTQPLPTGPTVDALTLDDVRAGQIAALRQLSGFTATAEVTTTSTPYSLDGAPMAEQTSTRTAEITLLPDGSFWSQTSADEWGSYDPATHTVRGAFRSPEGVLQYQEIVGQPDNSIPLGVISGMFPTQLVGGTQDDSTRVEDTTLDGRAVWQITNVMVYDPARCQGDGCGSEPYSQTIVQTVDQQTGLMIRSSNATTDQHGTSQVAALRDVRPVDTMPAGFPGTFPPDAAVDRSGDPNIATSLTMADIPAHFGIATPLPAGLDTVTVTAGEMMGPSVDNDDPAGPSYRTRTADIVAHDGFLNMTISVRATVAADAPTDDLVIDGYVCRNGDGDQDGACDKTIDGSASGLPGSRTITIEHGALAGREVLVVNGGLSINVGIFDINILAPTNAEAIAIANTFEFR